MVILLKRPDLEGSIYSTLSVVLALSSPLQPLRPFQPPHFLHFRHRQSHTSNLLPCDQTGENNVHIAASQGTQSATVGPGFCVEAGSSPALTCSSHLHLPTRHLGRQAVICVFVCVCLTVTHLSCSHLERIFICRARCLQRRLFMSDWIFIQQPLFLPHLPPKPGTVAGLKRVAVLLPGNGGAEV